MTGSICLRGSSINECFTFGHLGQDCLPPRLGPGFERNSAVVAWRAAKGYGLGRIVP